MQHVPKELPSATLWLAVVASSALARLSSGCADPVTTPEHDTAVFDIAPTDTAAGSEDMTVQPDAIIVPVCGVEALADAPVASDVSMIAPTAAGSVRGVWLSPADRPFPAGLQARLERWLALADSFFASELERWQGRALHLTPQRTADGHWDVVFLRGEHDQAFYHSHPTAPDAAGEALAEVFRRLPSDFHRDAILVYFYDLAVADGPQLGDTGQAGSAAPWQGDHAGYALIGAHVLGFGFDTVRIDPATQSCVFDDALPSGLDDYDGDGVMRALDRGEWASTFVGASIHELGHAFGLDHVFDDADGDGVENNLMGNGFRRFGGRFTERLPQPPTVLGPTSSEALVLHPYLTDSP